MWINVVGETDITTKVAGKVRKPILTQLTLTIIYIYIINMYIIYTYTLCPCPELTGAQ